MFQRLNAMCVFKAVLYIALGIGALQLTSVLSLLFLNSTQPAWPFTAIKLMFDGTFTPVMLSVFLTGLCCVAGFYWYQGAVVRLWGFALAYLVATLVIASSLAIGLFNHYANTQISLAPWLIYALLADLPRTGNLHLELINYFLWSILGVLLIPLLIYILKLKPLNEKILGNAHFANTLEIYRAGFFADQGIIIGKACGKMLRVPGHEGVLIFSPTGAGKTAVIGIPNLLMWQGSAVINDLKGELYKKTHHYRKTVLDQGCYEWNPQDLTKTTARLNPFAYVRYDSELRIRDLQFIAESFIPAERVDGGFWYTNSRQLLIMMAIYLFETKGMATFGDIHDLAKRENFVGWLAYEVQEAKIKDPVFYQNAYSFLGADEDRTQKNILSDFHTRLSLFADPLVCYATSANDFDMRALRKTPMSIYLHIKDGDKERLKSILTLIWAIFADVLSQKEPTYAEEPYDVLALLDEFGNMTKIEKLKEGMTFFRSYHIRPIIIIQDRGQVISAYGEHGAKGFLNAKVRMCFTLNDLEDAKWFSQAMGEKTVKLKSKGSSSGGESRANVNTSVQSRALMKPDEILRMNKKYCLIISEGNMPIKTKKCYWFKEKVYRRLIPEWANVQ